MAHNNLGNAYQAVANASLAIASYNVAIKLAPNFADAHNNLGVVLSQINRPKEAFAHYKHALNIKPNAEVLNNLGHHYQEEGDANTARQFFEKALGLSPNYAPAHRHLSSLSTYSNENDEHIIQMEKFIEDGSLQGDNLCQIKFALAKAFEDVGNKGSAFKLYCEANKIRKDLLKYAKEEDDNLFSHLTRLQPKFREHALSEYKPRDLPIPLFIIGMPRSGTTLVEQILSNHSSIFAGGELPYMEHLVSDYVNGKTTVQATDLHEIRTGYYNYISKLSSTEKYVTDKMPHNFRFLPIICAAFPEAKFIHIKRSPQAVCWSNFKQYFSTNKLGYCYDLQDVVHFHNLYVNMMQLWKKLYTSSLFPVSYELLTEDPEQIIRDILIHLGLNWETKCLNPEKSKRRVRTASSEQVRNEIYRGSSEVLEKVCR